MAAIVADGRRSFLYGRTRAEVRRALGAAVKARDDGLSLSAGRETLDAYTYRWLGGVEGSVRSSTLEKYRRDLEHHILPNLGRVPLARLGPQHLQHCYSALSAAGLSPTSVRHVHAVLHRALGQAVRWGLISRNVADVVVLPQIRRASWQVLDASEVRRLLAAAAVDRLEAVYVLACTAGLRRGEVLALRWRDLDLDRAVLSVTGSLQRVGGALTISEPKTVRSRRLIVLSEVAVTALYRRRSRQLDERALAGQSWQEHGLVFTSAVGGPIEPGNLLRRSFWPLLDRAGLPHVRFHDLRHTAATLMLSRGVHPKVASELLGHSTVGVTLDLYSHVSESMQRGTARVMDDIFKPE
jgi:integrase